MEDTTKIFDNLFLGNIISSQTGTYDLVINCSNNVGRHTPFISENYINIPIDDTPTDEQNQLFLNNLEYLTSEIYKFLSLNKKVLVHCHVGMSRSATLIVALLLRFTKFTLIESIVYVKNLRPIVFAGGVHFEKALLQFQKMVGK